MPRLEFAHVAKAEAGEVRLAVGCGSIVRLKSSLSPPDGALRVQLLQRPYVHFAAL
jgi:hypothetical protein